MILAAPEFEAAPPAAGPLTEILETYGQCLDLSRDYVEVNANTPDEEEIDLDRLQMSADRYRQTFQIRAPVKLPGQLKIKDHPVFHQVFFLYIGPRKQIKRMEVEKASSDRHQLRLRAALKSGGDGFACAGVGVDPEPARFGYLNSDVGQLGFKLTAKHHHDIFSHRLTDGEKGSSLSKAQFAFPSPGRRRLLAKKLMRIGVYAK